MVALHDYRLATGVSLTTKLLYLLSCVLALPATAENATLL